MNNKSDIFINPPPRRRIVPVSRQKSTDIPEVSTPRRARSKSAFTKSEVSRAIDAVRKTGLNILAVSLDPNGVIRVRTGEAAKSEPNDFDEWQDRL